MFNFDIHYLLPEVIHVFSLLWIVSPFCLSCSCSREMDLSSTDMAGANVGEFSFLFFSEMQKELKCN